jgi:hypothetical protein
MFFVTTGRGQCVGHLSTSVKWPPANAKKEGGTSFSGGYVACGAVLTFNPPTHHI